MQKLKILNKKEVKRISSSLEENFGVSLPEDQAYLLSEKDRLYMVNMDFSSLDENFRIDSVGLYIGTLAGSQLRLSIEGSQIIGKDATKGIIVLSDQDFARWMKGEELNTDKAGIFMISNGKDFAGCSVAKEGRMINYVPKERRI